MASLKQKQQKTELENTNNPSLIKSVWIFPETNHISNKDIWIKYGIMVGKLNRNCKKKDNDLWFQWSRILRFPETILFSRMAPDGISMRSPWLAMIITVPWNRIQRYRFYSLLREVHKFSETNQYKKVGWRYHTKQLLFKNK